MGYVWKTFAPLTKRHDRALKNLEIAFPEKSIQERDSIARQMWENFGCTFAESLLIDRLIDAPKRVSVKNIDVLDHALKAQKGIVFVAPHLANWEVLGIPLSTVSLEMAGLYQSIRNPYLDAYVRRHREKLYRGGMFSKGHASLRKIMTFVKNGGCVGMLADHREHRGIEVPFFGLPAPSTPFPAMLARWLDVTIIACRPVRLENSTFEIHLHAIPVARNGEKNQDIQETTAIIQSVFQEWISQCPQQWMWAHRRWSRTGESPNSLN